jgi:hypothetical protein
MAERKELREIERRIWGKGVAGIGVRGSMGGKLRK